MPDVSIFKRFVEPGRLALITYGPCEGRLCTVIDIVDQKRVIVDGPFDLTGVKRHMMPVKRLSLTDLKCNIMRNSREKTLRKALAEEDILNKWSQTSWAKKIAAREARANMNDYERHMLMVARRCRAKQVRKVLKDKMKKK